MRKNKLKTIKKTVERLHRKVGTKGFTFPAGLNTDTFRFFKIFGNSDINEDGALLGVGDYNEESGKYQVGIEFRSNNLLGGKKFAEIFTAKKVSNVNSVTATEYITAPKTTCNDTVIIDKSIIPFKEKTAYTIATSVRYFNNETSRNIRLKFNYSDGTDEFPIMDVKSMNVVCCLFSDADKSLVSISCYSTNNQPIAYSLEKFGIYEGTHIIFDDVHEEYTSEKSNILLNAPLFRIGYTSDEIDLVGKTVIRKINTLIIDVSTSVSLTESEGIFKVSLPLKKRKTGGYFSSLGILSEESTSGVSILDDCETLMFKISDAVKTEEELMAYLEISPITIHYVMETPISEAIDVQFSAPEKKCIFDVCSAVNPYKTVLEYI